MSRGFSKRLTRILGRSKDESTPGDELSQEEPLSENASPEEKAIYSVRQFCNPRNPSNSGDEVVHLPALVEAASSSPDAAAAAVRQIKTFMEKDYSSKPHVQYNAVMLLRILSDNPGTTVTSCFDKAFVNAVKELLRKSEVSTQHLLREYLDSLAVHQNNQPGVEPLVGMWLKEKNARVPLTTARYPVMPANAGPPQGDYMLYQHAAQAPVQSSNRRRGQLPPPDELEKRITEARNTASMLLQLCSSTPQDEVLTNELIREFRERCQTAQRSIEGYINCDNPPPDEETMLTLIETNEKLSLAATRCQRCVLAARKATGGPPTPSTEAEATQNGKAAYPFPGSKAPASSQNQHLAPSSAQLNGSSVSAFGASTNSSRQSSVRDFATSSRQAAQQQQLENPFADPEPGHSDVEADALPAGIAQGTRVQPVQTFRIDSGPSYPAVKDPYANPVRRNTAELNNLYAPTPSEPPQRTAYGTEGPTTSYIGRQTDAANGLTMHGAGADEPQEGSKAPQLPQIEDLSGARRLDASTADDDDDDAYQSSPVRSRVV